MYLDIGTMRKIYSALGDDESKEIFMNRIMFSFSGESRWMYNIIRLNRRIKEFAVSIQDCSKKKDVVIFGAGTRGRQLCEVLNFIPWKCFVDSHPQIKELGGVPVISYDEFVANYQGEYVIISSRIYRKEMKEQLAKNNIIDNVVDFGETLEELIDDQYFDLEYIQPTDEKEVFVDVGCYDARSSINFARWCQGNAFVYAFEPNSNQIEECKRNLRAGDIEYKIIPKGLWSDEKDLHFTLSGSGSRIEECGEEIVAVTTLDKELGNEKVTFIKMDIEGSEMEALIGAKDVIKRNRPKLAICVYHKAEDIFLIPDFILQCYSGYRFYLRHYSLRNSETILYALPT